MKKERYQAPGMKQMVLVAEEELLQFVSDSYSDDPQLADEAAFDDSIDDSLEEHQPSSSLWD